MHMQNDFERVLVIKSTHIMEHWLMEKSTNVKKYVRVYVGRLFKRAIKKKLAKRRSLGRYPKRLRLKNCLMKNK